MEVVRVFGQENFKGLKAATEKQENKKKKLRSSLYAGHDESYNDFNHPPFLSRKSAILAWKGTKKFRGNARSPTLSRLHEFLQTEKESASCNPKKTKNKFHSIF
jgi:hypothetical protein